MGGKSKRYFRHDRRSSSKSPEHSRSHRSTSHSSHSKSRSPTRYHHSSATAPTKYSDNKSASEKLKKSIQDKLKNASKSIDNTSALGKSPKVFVTLDDQVKRSEAIDKINNSKFQPQSFSSSNRNKNSQTCSKQNSIDLLKIPLPEDDNSWRDNPKLLIDPSLQVTNAKEREQKWINNLLMLRNGLLSR